MQAGWVIMVLVGQVPAEDDFELGQAAAYLIQVHEDLVGLNQGSTVHWGRHFPIHFVKLGSLCLAPLVYWELVLADNFDPYPE